MTIQVPPFEPPYNEDEDTVRTRLDAGADATIEKREGDWYQTLTQPGVIEKTRQWDSLNDVIMMTSVLYALGEYLDRLAFLHRITRNAATYATGEVTFTGTNGTTIPVGTTVNAPTTSDEQPTVSFVTTELGTIAGGEITVPVVATETGSLWNIAASAITTLEDSISGVTDVTNDAAFSNGAEIEDDESLRQRVLEKIQTPQAAGSAGDYERWALEEAAIGAATVTPQFNGNNNAVLVTLLDRDNNPVSQTVMDDFQRRMSGDIVLADPTTMPSIDLIDHNLLTVNQASVETDLTGIGGAQTNNTSTRSTTMASSGTASLRLSSTAAGDMSTVFSDGTSGVAVVAGNTYTGTAEVRSGASARSVKIALRWYTAAGAFISESEGTASASNTATWGQRTVTAVAPPTAAFAALKVVVLATGGAAELHYFDKFMVRVGSGTTWVAGGTSASGNVPVGTHYYRVSFVDQYLGETKGSPEDDFVVFSSAKQVRLTSIPLGPTGTTKRRVYRASSASGPYYLLSNGEIADNVTTVLTDNDSNATLLTGDIAPSTNNTTNHTGVAPVGAWVFVDTPTTVPIDIVATVTYEDGYSFDGASGTTALQTEIETYLQDYINSLEPGDDVIYNHVRAQFFKVEGVHDVTALTVEGGSINVSISVSEVADYTTPTIS